MSAYTTIIGNVCANPEMRMIGQQAACTFRVAAHTNSKDKNGEYITNFYDCTIFGKRGERFCNRAQKGSSVTVWGESSAVEYTDKNGQLRTALRINADNGEVHTKIKGLDNRTTSQTMDTPAPAPAPVMDPASSILPF